MEVAQKYAMEEKDGEEELILSRVEGWIHKKGGAVKGSALAAMKNWKKRYFYLENVGTVQMLYELKYYDKPGGTLKGTVKMKGTEVYCDRSQSASNAKNKRFEFQILLTNGSMLKLYCDDATERDEWVESLNYVITAMKVKPPPVRNSMSLKNATFSEMVEFLSYNPMNEDETSNFEAGKEIASACQAFGSGLFGAEAGHNAQFMIQSYSAEGDMLDGGGLPFSICLVDDECLYHIISHDNDDGTYSAFYSVSRPGKYKLHVKLNDLHHIAGSPFDVEILPSYTTASQCTATGECLSKIPSDSKSTFQIIARDNLGNKKKRGGDPFEIGVMGPAMLHGLTDNNDGSYTCTLEAKQPSLMDYVTSASLSILVTLHGKHISGSPFHPTVESTTAPQEPERKKDKTVSKSYQRDTHSPPPRKNKPSAALFQRYQPSSGMVDSPPPSNALSMEDISHPSPPHDTPPSIRRNPRSSQDSQLHHTPSSKLEQARQKALSRMTSAESRGAPDIDDSPPPPPPPPESPQNRRSNHVSLKDKPASVKDRLSKLDMMTKKFGQSSLGKISRSASSHPPGQNKSTSSSQLSQSQSRSRVTQDGFVKSFSAGLLSSSPPDDLSNEVRRAWIVTNDALPTSEVINVMVGNVAGMEKCFQLVCENDLAPLSHTELSVGLFKLFEEFDVIPAYLSKKDLKSLLQLCLRSQSMEAGTLLENKNSLSFVTFMKLLVMSCLYCLSKTSTLNSLYPTIKAKLDVMLFNWGFADPLKIKTVSNRLRQSQ